MQIKIEESDYSIAEGEESLNKPIRLQFRNNQNAFNITFSAITIAAAEGMGVGNFINSDTIKEEARATAGGVFGYEICDCSQWSRCICIRCSSGVGTTDAPGAGTPP